ncbi:hypothetical protein S40288_06188 [Stachybotrys chartarum IBT 40288]|nr:hypothetical protein S40288_06188 [Stachybotrys chartarum IBT 40288]
MAAPLSSGLVDPTTDIDASRLAGKTAIVTGGANGIGEAYIRALQAADSCADGRPFRTLFVQCNVTNWDEQVELFRKAAAFSPTGKIHYVIANAGITRDDEVFKFDGLEKGPQRPNLSIIDVNVYGTLYTTKLSLHYFVAQNGTEPNSDQDDTCLILIGSGAAIVDVPRTPQYQCTKWGARGIMHALRGTAFYYGGRVNMISPWYVRTKILSQEAFDHVRDVGVEFATTEDAGQLALRILGDPSINGRNLFLCPRKWAPKGYLDLDLEDPPKDSLLAEIQADQIKGAPVELGLFL